MVLGALIFGYFGFVMGWAHERTLDDELLWAVVLLKWSLRIGAILFALSAVLAYARFGVASTIAGVTSLATSIAFLVVAAWDWSMPQYSSGVHPLLLILFAAWNGWGGIEWIREQGGAGSNLRGGDRTGRSEDRQA